MPAKNNKNKMISLLALGIIGFVCLQVFVPGFALAHRINVFCWMEGRRIICQSRFSADSPVKNGTVQVYSQETKELLYSGRTDSRGEISLEIPSKAIANAWNLKVVCRAGAGHENYWIVRHKELQAAAGEKDQPRQPASLQEKQSKQSPQPASGNETAKSETSVSRSEIREIVARELQRELGPLKKDLKLLQQDRVSLQDILGGIGYILGIMGIIFFFKGKKA